MYAKFHDSLSKYPFIMFMKIPQCTDATQITDAEDVNSASASPQ